MGAGLRRVLKLTGGMSVSSGGTTVEYVWDYAADKPALKADMPFGSERHKLSERAKWLQNPPRNALQCAARACPGCNVCGEPPNVEATRPGKARDDA